jgi:hypothetical protein
MSKTINTEAINQMKAGTRTIPSICSSRLGVIQIVSDGHDTKLSAAATLMMAAPATTIIQSVTAAQGERTRQRPTRLREPTTLIVIPTLAFTRTPSITPRLHSLIFP